MHRVSFLMSKNQELRGMMLQISMLRWRSPNVTMEPIIPLPVDATINASHNSNASNSMSYRVPGEHICAISFRKITSDKLPNFLIGHDEPKIESGSWNKWFVQPRMVGGKETIQEE